LLRRQRAYTDAVQATKSQIIPWVFHRAGKPIKSYRTGWESACVKAGLPGAWIHDFRRSAANHMENTGVPRSQAMKITGHKTESIYRRYAIVRPDDIAEGTAKLSAYRQGLAQTGKAQAKQSNAATV
jgi:integrase